MSLPVPVLLIVFALQGWTESGIWKDSLLKKVLENIPGVKVVIVDYLDGKGKLAQFRSHLTAEQYAARAERVYRQTQTDYPGIPILVLGHSLGGIIARYLCTKGLFPSKNMILAGAPNEGIIYSAVGGPVFGLIVFPLLWLLSSEHFCNVPVYRQLLMGSDFLTELNRHGIPWDAYYIKGHRDTTVPTWSSDPNGIGCRANCDHHLFPFNGRDINSLSKEELKTMDNSAIPLVAKIVKEELENYKTRV